MAGAAQGVAATMRSILFSRMAWILLAIWVATRALMVAKVGFWHDGSVNLEDVDAYHRWSDQLAGPHTIPSGDAWQYPPGAAFLMLLPRLGPGTYGDSFVGLMLLFDLLGLGLLAWLGRRSGRLTGVWVWTLGLPLLGVYPVLRFDLVPTVIAIAALVVIHRRPAWFGALVGLGASIKAWPIVLLFGEWDRRRLLTSALAAGATMALVLLVAAIAFGDVSGFLDAQRDRGLQAEAVATAPWQLRELITGEVTHQTLRFGAWEISDHSADVFADVLRWLGIAVLAAASVWWWLRERAIRAGRTDLTEASVSL